MFYKVSFQYSEYVFCTNIAEAANIADVEKYYSVYEWASVKEAEEHEIREAETKGMPFVKIEAEEQTAEEQTAEEQTAEEAEEQRPVICGYEEFSELLLDPDEEQTVEKILKAVSADRVEKHTNGGGVIWSAPADESAIQEMKTARFKLQKTETETILIIA